jgi:hypothetical protein
MPLVAWAALLAVALIVAVVGISLLKVIYQLKHIAWTLGAVIVGVIPEAAQLVKAGFVVFSPFFWSFPACFGCAAPAAGVQAQRPQRSEDERPGGWRG